MSITPRPPTTSASPRRSAGRAAPTCDFNNSRVETSDVFSNFNPTFTTGLTFAYTQPLLRGLFIDSQRQQLQITQINREISEETLRADHHTDPGQRAERVLGSRLREELGGRRTARAAARRQAGRGQPRTRRSRHARAARHRAGRSGSRQPPADARRRRSHAADRGARAQALYRQRHRGSAVASGAAADRPAIARARSHRHRRRGPQGARAPNRSGHRAQQSRQLGRDDQVLPQPVAAGARPASAATARRASAAPQLLRSGSGVTQHHHRHGPGRLRRRALAAGQPRLSELEPPAQRLATTSAPARRMRSMRAPACRRTRRRRVSARSNCRSPPK